MVNETVYRTLCIAKDLLRMTDVRSWPYLLSVNKPKIIKLTGVGNIENNVFYYLSIYHFINNIPFRLKLKHYDYLVSQSFLHKEFVECKKPKIFFTREPWSYMTPETTSNLRNKELEQYWYRYDEPNIDKRMFYTALIKKTLPSIIVQRKRNIFEKRSGFCCIINRYAENDGCNLLKHRIRFVQAMRSDVHIYGNEPWQGRNKWRDFDTYKGSVKDKIKTFSKYTFAITFENTDYPGYITEKIFDALVAGTIPLYWGGGYLKETIPVDCYVDCCNQDPKTIYQFIKNMSQGTIIRYREAAINFLESSSAHRFTRQYFTESIVKRLISQEL